MMLCWKEGVEGQRERDGVHLKDILALVDFHGCVPTSTSVRFRRLCGQR